MTYDRPNVFVQESLSTDSFVEAFSFMSPVDQEEFLREALPFVTTSPTGEFLREVTGT